MFNISHRGKLTVITSSLPHCQTCALGIFIKWGARFEPERIKGAAHFIEHMLFKGSRHYSYRRIKQQIEGRGGSINGFTSQEVTAYYAQFLHKNLPRTSDILFDMVCNPLLDEKEIEKERNVILEEIKMYRDLPHSRALSVLDALLWSGHPLGIDVVGTEQTVSRIKRSDLARLRERYYRPPHILVFCTGAFDEQMFLSRLGSAAFSGEKSSPQKVYGKPAGLPRRKIVVETKKIDQTHLCLGFPSVSYTHPLRFAVELLHVLMGANMSSRLFEEIREKRALCYDVSTEVRKYKDSGAFIIHCALDKRNIPLAFKCILDQLRKIKESPPSGRELERAKDYLLGQLAMNLERPMGRLFYLADSFIALNKIYTFEQLTSRIRRIPPDTIIKLASRIFNFKKACVTCVGNVEGRMHDVLSRQIEEGSR